MEQGLVRQQPMHFDIFNQEQFNMMQRACKVYASSELVPDMYKVSEKNPIEKAMANCMIAIEMSQRIGASTLMIMQNMDIIYGRPAWRSAFLIATVNTCGRFAPIKYKFESLGMIGKLKITEYVWDNALKRKVPKDKEFDGTNLENTQCIAWTTSADGDVLESAPITIAMAIEQGWYLKDGSKWPSMPKQMLMYRAAAFWTRAYAPEISMGMHTVEEQQDIVETTYVDVTDKVKADIANNAGSKPTAMDPTPEPTAPEPEKDPDPQPTPVKDPAPAEPQAAAMDPEPAQPEAKKEDPTLFPGTTNPPPGAKPRGRSF